MQHFFCHPPSILLHDAIATSISQLATTSSPLTFTRFSREALGGHNDRNDFICPCSRRVRRAQLPMLRRRWGSSRVEPCCGTLHGRGTHILWLVISVSLPSNGPGFRKSKRALNGVSHVAHLGSLPRLLTAAFQPAQSHLVRRISFSCRESRRVGATVDEITRPEVGIVGLLYYEI